MTDVFDVVIIGGGINGCGCAADAALRGLSVLLCEQDDLASKTSSSSSKLIHGGLRYLEHFEFNLVKKALDEQQLLLQLAPHLINPLPFVLPYQKNRRPVWLLRAGLFLYDHLSRKNQLPNSKLIRRSQNPIYFESLFESLTKGFLFYDCTTDDARLTITNAIQAKDHGASILTQTRLIDAKIVDNQWHLSLQTDTGSISQVKAKVVINAAGPWVESVNQLLQIPSQHTMSLIKGSHVVVPRLYEGNFAYLLQHDDKRIVFTIPYQGYTLIGTTDVNFNGSLDDVSIESSELDYLLELTNSYFKKQLGRGEIITTWSGIRPLVAESGKPPRKLSRDYSYHVTNQPAPAVSIYSGKITTYRQLASDVINQLNKVFPHLSPSRTDITPLPGAMSGTMRFADYQQYARLKYPWLDDAIRERYLSSYGTRTEELLADRNHMDDLGIQFTDTLYQAEVDYLRQEEWAKTCEDILWRRTKLGLFIKPAEQKALEQYLRLTS